MDEFAFRTSGTYTEIQSSELKKNQEMKTYMKWGYTVVLGWVQGFTNDFLKAIIFT